MNATPHPDKHKLEEYACGKLADDEASSVAKHLTECPECESTIEALESQSDTLASGLKGQAAPEPYAGESELRRAVQNVAKIPGGAQSQASRVGASSDKVSTKAPVKLGPYQLLAKLGEGGMGAVFKARHEHLDKIVAIKVLPKKAMADPAAVARFRREMKAVGALHHPNIVGAHDAGEAQGVHFLVMEYVAGSDLSSLIKKQGPVTVEQAISYMMQAAKGLAFAHAKNIVHRDIKPANLLVDGEGTVKILDMGLARLDDGGAANAEANQGLTQTGQVMGTVDYMAPEQAFDTHRADAKADVYSLGCTLYRILTGENAFRGETIVQKILAHREQPIPSLVKARAEVPAALDAIYQRMMAKQPEQRPTMAELVKSLEALSDASSTAAGPAIVIDVAKKGSGDRGQGTDRLAASPATRATPSESGRRSKPPVKLIAAGIGGFALLVSLGVWVIIHDKGGNEVARVQVPDGGGMILKNEPGASATGVSVPSIKPPVANAPGSPAPSFFSSVTSTAAPLPGDYALEFDGDTARVETPVVLDLAHPFTIETRASLLDALSKNHVVLSSDQFELGISGDRWHVNFQDENNKGIKLRCGETAMKKPAQLAAAYDGRELRFFVDGVLIGAQAVTSLRASSKSISLGDLPGTIDEVRISKSARYTDNYTPQRRFEPDADTVALYHFDEGTGDVLHDASGNKHDGKIVAAKWVRPDGSAIPPPTAPPPGRYALEFGQDDTKLVTLPVVDRWLDRDAPFTVEAYLTPTSENMRDTFGFFAAGGLRMQSLERWIMSVAATGSNSRAVIAQDPKKVVLHRRVHVAGVRTRKDIKLFVDGKLVDTKPFSGQISFFGGNWLGSGLIGRIDQFRISSTARYERDFTPEPILGSGPSTEVLYLFDEGTGDILKDASGHGHDATITGAKWVRADGSANPPPTAPPPTAPPPGDYALRFGGDGEVSIPSPGITHADDCTIEGYAKIQALQGSGVLVGSKLRLELRLQGTTVPGEEWCFAVNGMTKWPSAMAPPRGQRIHVAGIKRGKTYSLYLDGKLASRSDLAGETLNPINQPWAIGTGFMGVLDEVRISGKPRYAGDFTPPTRHEPDADTLALYHCDEGAGDVLVDSSGHGRHGKITKPLWVRSDGGPIPVPSPTAPVTAGPERPGSIAGPSGTGAAPIDVLQQVDLKRDVVSGNWTKHGAALHSKESWARIQTQIVPPERYTVDAVVEEIQDGYGIAFGLPLGGGIAFAVLDGKGMSGLDTAGVPFSEKPAARGTLFTPGKRAAVRIIVEPDGFSVACDGRPVFEWRGDPKTLVPPKYAEVPDPRHFVFAGSTEYAFHELRLTPNVVTAPPGKGTTTGQITTHLQPDFQQWVKETQALPAEQQIDAVSKKLMELNPGFDGKLTNSDYQGTPKVKQGVVTDLGFISDQVRDISPVRALTGLQRLGCAGSDDHKGSLTDLSPLAGMPLAYLSCGSSQVSDLSPLAGMKLETLLCGKTPLSDLTPLSRLPLKYLHCAGSNVSNLSALAGLPLTTLACYATSVSDLSPLRGMQLSSLQIQWTQIKDLSPLTGMKLTTLSIVHTPVNDLSPLRGMPLKDLGCDLASTADKAFIRSIQSLEKINGKPAAEFWKEVDVGVPPPGQITTHLQPEFQQWVKETQALPADKQLEAVSKKLTELNPGYDGKFTARSGSEKPFLIENGVVTELRIISDAVADLSPVRALTGLKVLFCMGVNVRGCALKDLSPLTGMQLTTLACSNSQVESLEPLAGMPLAKLYCGLTKVKDLSPLRGMQLTLLDLWQASVTDLSHLEGMPLTVLTVYGCPGVKDISPLKGLPLEQLDLHGTQVSDLSALRGIPLVTLVCTGGTKVSDLSPLKDCKTLKKLALGSNTAVTAESVADLQKILPDCKIEWAPKADPQSAIPNTKWDTPAFQQWVKETQALPADKQLEAVSKKLMELNPGFDGKLTGWRKPDAPPMIEKGVVTEVDFSTENVTDLSPVRGFPGLKRLRCTGGLMLKGKLTDLSPLAGMPLTKLEVCENLKLSDLSPLRGMKLTELDAHYTAVTDWTPLAGMPLVALNTERAITDLSFLKGMPLELLWIHGPFSDLSVLRDMKLRHLSCGRSQVSDLSPLKGMATLTILNCDETQVADLSPLAGCEKLGKLTVKKTKVTAEQVAALQKALPNCKIEWDDPAKATTSGSADEPNK